MEHDISTEQLRNAATRKRKTVDRATPSNDTVGQANTSLANLAQNGDLTFAELGKNLAQRHASIFATSYVDNMPTELSIAMAEVEDLFDNFDLPLIDHQTIAGLLGGVA